MKLVIDFVYLDTSKMNEMTEIEQSSCPWSRPTGANPQAIVEFAHAVGKAGIDLPPFPLNERVSPPPLNDTSTILYDQIGKPTRETTPTTVDRGGGDYEATSSGVAAISGAVCFWAAVMFPTLNLELFCASGGLGLLAGLSWCWVNSGNIFRHGR